MNSPGLLSSKHTSRQACRQGKKARKRTDKHAVWQAGSLQADREAGRQADRQTNRQTKRQAGKQTDRQAGGGLYSLLRLLVASSTR